MSILFAAVLTTLLYCDSHEALTKRIKDRYQEELQSIAITENDRLLEVFVNDETGTWSILVTSHEGESCLLASGGEWTDKIKPKQET